MVSAEMTFDNAESDLLMWDDSLSRWPEASVRWLRSLPARSTRCTVEDLRGGDAKENAALLREALEAGDHTNAKRDAIVLNAGVGCYVFGLADSIPAGIDLARAALNEGKGLATLDEWIATTQKLSA